MKEYDSSHLDGRLIPNTDNKKSVPGTICDVYLIKNNLHSWKVSEGKQMGKGSLLTLNIQESNKNKFSFYPPALLFKYSLVKTTLYIEICKANWSE